MTKQRDSIQEEIIFLTFKDDPSLYIEATSFISFLRSRGDVPPEKEYIRDILDDVADFLEVKLEEIQQVAQETDELYPQDGGNAIN